MDLGSPALFVSCSSGWVWGFREFKRLGDSGGMFSCPDDIPEWFFCAYRSHRVQTMIT